MDEAVLIPAVNVAAAEVGAINDEAHRWLIPQDRWPDFMNILQRELGPAWSVASNLPPHGDRLILTTGNRTHELKLEAWKRNGGHVVRIDTQGDVHV
jgi:hypothetical protein